MGQVPEVPKNRPEDIVRRGRRRLVALTSCHQLACRKTRKNTHPRRIQHRRRRNPGHLGQVRGHLLSELLERLRVAFLGRVSLVDASVASLVLLQVGRQRSVRRSRRLRERTVRVLRFPRVHRVVLLQDFTCVIQEMEILNPSLIYSSVNNWPTKKKKKRSVRGRKRKVSGPSTNESAI